MARSGLGCWRRGVAMLAFGGMLAVTGGEGQAADTDATPRNLVIIQTDEHNFRTLGCYRALLAEEEAYPWGAGVAVETPHVDWLARHGAIALRCYASSPVCTPSRASFLSGRYPQNTGAWRNNLPMRDDTVTFAEVLRRRGYATGYAGKWHLDGPAKPGWAPQRRFGFSDNTYLFNRGHWKQLEATSAGPRVKARNAKGAPSYAIAGADAKSFTTDFLTDRAIAFIQSATNEPFCFMLSLPDPHGPNTVRAPYDTMFEHLPFQSPRTSRQAGEGLPKWGRTESAKFNAKQMSQYFGMVKCIDDNVGRIVAALRDSGCLEHTVVVFTADHGDLCGEHGRYNKGVPMDGSARIPLIIYARGLIAAGTVVSPVLGTVDFKPTILGLLGVEAGDHDEGRNAAALFRSGQIPASWRDITFCRIGGEGSGWMGAFTSRFKFVLAPNDTPCLFDLEADPEELKNMFRHEDYQETVRSLGRELAMWAERYGEPHADDPGIRAELKRLR